MFFFNFDKSNSSLHEIAETDEDVSILIGENGSGKSFFLNELYKHHWEAGKKVIVLANTVFDKFENKKGSSRILRNSAGKRLPRTAMRSIISTILEGKEESKSAIRNAMRYIGFDLCLDIRLNGLNLDKLDASLDHVGLINGYFFLPHILKEYIRIIDTMGDDYARINLEKEYYEGSQVDILRFFVYEKWLKKMNLVDSVEIFLVKKGDRIPILSASSGELTLLSSLIFISAHINKNTIILIDEPENSLHPKWQIDYIKNIVDIFYFHQPKIIIATHSPLIINGGRTNLNHLSIYKGNRNGFFLVDSDRKNVEEMYEDYFDVTTPENRFLSEFVMGKLNLLADNKIKREDFEKLIDRLINKSYDTRQKEALEGILELSKKID